MRAKVGGRTGGVLGRTDADLLAVGGVVRAEVSDGRRGRCVLPVAIERRAGTDGETVLWAGKLMIGGKVRDEMGVVVKGTSEGKVVEV